MASVSLFLLFLYSLKVPWTKAHIQQANAIKRSRDLVYANFLQNEFHSLNVSKIASTLEETYIDCCFACVNNPFCFSVNVAVSTDINKKLQCDLLASNKYNSSEKFQKSSEFHHYSIYVSNMCFWFMFACFRDSVIFLDYFIHHQIYSSTYSIRLTVSKKIIGNLRPGPLTLAISSAISRFNLLRNCA